MQDAAAFDKSSFANGASAGAYTATSLENGAPGDDAPSTLSVSAGQLRAVIERVERLEEEKKEIMDQIKEVYAEAKGTGFDVKTLRKIVALRKKKPEERSEEEAMLDLYMSALGMLPE